MGSEPRFVVYGGTSNHGFDARVLDIVQNQLGFSDLKFSHIRYKDFPDDEPGGFLTNREAIKGSTVIVFSCPFDIEHREELHDIVTAAKRQFGAKKVVAVLTFLTFRRQDREEKVHETTRLRWFFHDLKFWGADYAVVCEPHSLSNTTMYAVESGIKLFIADPTTAFSNAVLTFVESVGSENVVVYSPDLGSAYRAGLLASKLGVTMVSTPKKRLYGDSVEVNGETETEFMENVIERCPCSVKCVFDPRAVSGKHVLMREDEVQTGETSEKMARVLRRIGAKSIRLLAAHPVCTSGWQDKLVPHDKQKPFDEIFFGNARPRGKGDSAYKESTGGEVRTVDLAGVFAGALMEVIGEIINSPEA